jgi:hypothetical protein
MLLGIGLIAVFMPQAFATADLASLGFQPERLPWMGAALFVLSLLGLFLLTRPARRLFARFTPIDPSHPVHAVALSMTALILVNLAFTVAIGLDNSRQPDQHKPVCSQSCCRALGLNIIFVLMGLIGGGCLPASISAGLIRLASSLHQFAALSWHGRRPMMVPVVILAGAGKPTGARRQRR